MQSMIDLSGPAITILDTKAGALACRAVAFTALNAQSSRSHGIVMLTIIKRPSSTPKHRAVGQKVKIGKLFMVDLAGSERLKKSRSTGGLRLPWASALGFRMGPAMQLRCHGWQSLLPTQWKPIAKGVLPELPAAPDTGMLVQECGPMRRSASTCH